MKLQISDTTCACAGRNPIISAPRIMSPVKGLLSGENLVNCPFDMIKHMSTAPRSALDFRIATYQ